MKAAVCREFGEPLVIEEVELAPPGAGEVQVKLAACAICHSDIFYAEGAWGGVLPAVYGHEAAGAVSAVGEGVTGIAEGTPVAVTLIRSCGHCHTCREGTPVRCDAVPPNQQPPLHTPQGESVFQAMHTGAFAEAVTVHASQVVPLPPELPMDCASLLSCGVITGLGAVVRTAQMPVGKNAVVIGTGGVGLNSIQGAVLSGASQVIAVDLSEAKLETARRFGATDAVNASTEDVADKVRHFTDGRGADYVFVTAGAKSAFQQGLGLLGWGGTLVAVGMPASGVMLEAEILSFAYREQRWLGSRMGSVRPALDIPWMASLYQQGRLKLDELISGRYPLEQINEAIADVNRGKALRNVIMF